MAIGASAACPAPAPWPKAQRPVQESNISDNASRSLEFVDLTKHTFATLMRRLSAAGFKGDFARTAVLPDWWDKSCESDASLLGEVEFRVARLTGAPLSAVRTPAQELPRPWYPNAQLRRVHDVDRDRLQAAIHAGLSVAAAATRSWRGGAPPVQLPPADPLVWRDQIRRPDRKVVLKDVLNDLWARGIPVVHVEFMPTPSFQGLACIVGDRPVVVLSHDFDEPAKLAFFVAHEVAHVVRGDCAPDRPVVDADDDLPADHQMEHAADLYAARALIGPAVLLEVEQGDFRRLAERAAALGSEHGVDPALLVRGWGKRTGDHKKATMAVHALWGMSGGKRAIREAFDAHIDLNAASDTDRSLLRCLFGDRKSVV